MNGSEIVSTTALRKTPQRPGVKNNTTKHTDKRYKAVKNIPRHRDIIKSSNHRMTSPIHNGVQSHSLEQSFLSHKRLLNNFMTFLYVFLSR